MNDSRRQPAREPLSASEQEEHWHLSQIRQRPSRLSAKPIGSVVRRLMAQSGYGQTQVSQQLAELWQSAAGDALAGLTRPGKLSRGVLLVLVSDSATLQELTFQKRKILSKLQQAAPQFNIRDLKPRVERID